MLDKNFFNWRHFNNFFKKNQSLKSILNKTTRKLHNVKRRKDKKNQSNIKNLGFVNCNKKKLGIKMHFTKYLKKWILVHRLPRDVLSSLKGDSIGEIFRRIKRLDHFLAASQLCPEFRECAKACFENRFKHVNIINSETLAPNSLPPKRARELLTTFGSSIESLSWTGCTSNHERNDYTFDLIAKHCGENLKELNLTWYHPDFDQVEFKSLEKLDLYFASPLNFRQYSSLKILIIRQLKSLEHGPWFVREMPNLQEIVFDGVNDLTDEMIAKFLTLNPNLRCLKVKDCKNITSSIIENIRNCSPNIEKLDIFFHRASDFSDVVVRKNILHLSFLRKLKSFNSDLGRYMSLETISNAFAENDIPIEDLSIGSLKPISEHDDAMLTLKTLKHLKIGSSVVTIFDDILIKAVKSQPALETINIEVNGWGKIAMSTIEQILTCGENLTQFSCEVKEMDIDKKSYESILKLAKNRVKIHIEVVRGEVEVPANILETNREWLNVVVSNRS